MALIRRRCVHSNEDHDYMDTHLLRNRAWQNKSIPSVYSYKNLITEVEKARSLCGNTLLYDWINFPLAYVQVIY